MNKKVFKIIYIINKGFKESINLICHKRISSSCHEYPKTLKN